MVWKTVDNADAGDSNHFGGNDRDKVSNLFNGVLDVDSVDINSLFTVRDNKFKLRNPANTFSYTFRTGAILADRDINVPLLTGTATIVVTPAVEDLDMGSFDVIGFRKTFNNKRQISVYPSENDNLLSVMLGAGDLTQDGDATEILDTDGYYIELRETFGGMGAADGGFFCIDVTRREHNFDIIIKFRVPDTSDRRLWLGFFTADPMGADTITTEHIGLRLSTDATNVNFVISHADGATQAETQLALADTAIHTIRILSDEANSKFQYSFDEAALTDLTTNIPAATTNLDIFNLVRDLISEGTTAHWDFWYLDGQADK